MSKSPLRRATALVAGSLIGMAGAVAFASPALAHHSEVKGSAQCVAGEWIVDWKVNAIGNGKPGQTFQFTQVDLTPAEYKLDNADIVTGKDLTAGVPLTAKQRIPAGSATSATLAVSAKWGRVADPKPVSDTVQLTGDCAKPPVEEPKPPVEEPSTPAEEPSTPAGEPSTPAEPPVTIPEDVPAEPIFNETCDTIEIGVDNTKNTTPFKVDYETSKGEKRTLTVPAGKKDSETFSATKGFTVKVTFTVEYKGKTYTDSGEVAYTQPEDCEDDGQGGGLPVTGAAAGGVAGGAAALLAIGAGMFFVARRRKVKFTA